MSNAALQKTLEGVDGYELNSAGNIDINRTDNGWRAIGDNDTQEYLDNPEKSIVVDFNTLANIEPAVLAVYDMPVSTDLEFCFDNTRGYFIDTNTGKRI